MPVWLIEASHLIGSIAGLVVVVVARGLDLRQRRTWGVAVPLMAVGVVASLAKGPDWVEALSRLGALNLLGVFGSAFYRVDAPAIFRMTPTGIASLVALLAAIVRIELFAYDHVAYRDGLWWDFALHGGRAQGPAHQPRAGAPRHGARAERPRCAARQGRRGASQSRPGPVPGRAERGSRSQHRPSGRQGVPHVARGGHS